MQLHSSNRLYTYVLQYLSNKNIFNSSAKLPKFLLYSWKLHTYIRIFLSNSSLYIYVILTFIVEALYILLVIYKLRNDSYETNCKYCITFVSFNVRTLLLRLCPSIISMASTNIKRLAIDSCSINLFTWPV